ncbi:MAG: hypothetical protein AAFP90_09350, partial [Planctomycetota bacterium]
MRSANRTSSHSASRSRLNRRMRKHRVQRLEDRRLLAAGSDDLSPLSDEFDNAADISQWSRIHETEGWNADQLQVYNVDQTQPGRLVMQPHTVSWYQDWRGPMAYKEVTGDFVITAEIHISDRDDIGDSDGDSIPDDAQFSLGGVMVRTPRAIEDGLSDWATGGENYVFLSLGHGTNGQMSYEVKTTTNSNSQLQLSPLNGNVATVQIARIGSQMLMLRRTDGDDWVVHQRYNRPDMPETLQIGLVSYSDWAKAGDFTPATHNSNVLEEGVAGDPTPGEPFNPDLVAGFEYARFARPELPEELEGLDLVNDATDEQLLSFLGDTPNQPANESQISVEVRVVDATGEAIESVAVGETFTAEIWVDDLRAAGTGVFSAFVDVEFDSDLATASSLDVADDFPNAQEGSLDDAGIVDEFG